MAHSLIRKCIKPATLNFLTPLAVPEIRRRLASVAAAADEDPPQSPSSFTFSSEGEKVYVKPPAGKWKPSPSSTVTMPMSFMTGSIVGKRFYKEVKTREADDGNGWTVMLDYRTLKTPSKRPLKLPSLPLAKAIAAEWEYQVLLLIIIPFSSWWLIMFYFRVFLSLFFFIWLLVKKFELLL